MIICYWDNFLFCFVSKKKIIDSIFGIVGSSGTKFLPLLFKILQTLLQWKRGNIWKSLPKIFRAERIWSRKDELTAKCPMINSWCKTVFVPRIFRLSLSALGCKLRVRNWVNYAGRQTARHVSEIRFSHRATFTLRDILAWEGNETQWNVTKKYEGKESEVEEGGWKGWKIEREREGRSFSVRRLSFSLSLFSLSLCLWFCFCLCLCLSFLFRVHSQRENLTVSRW